MKIENGLNFVLIQYLRESYTLKLGYDDFEQQPYLMYLDSQANIHLINTRT